MPYSLERGLVRGGGQNAPRRLGPPRARTRWCTRNPKHRTRDPEGNTIQDWKTFTSQPRPASGLGCLVCAIFARTRFGARGWSKCAGTAQISRARSYRTRTSKLRTLNRDGFRNRNLGYRVSGGNNLKGFKEFYLAAKARLSRACHIRSTVGWCAGVVKMRWDTPDPPAPV